MGGLGRFKEGFRKLREAAQPIADVGKVVFNKEFLTTAAREAVNVGRDAAKFGAEAYAARLRKELIYKQLTPEEISILEEEGLVMNYVPSEELVDKTQEWWMQDEEGNVYLDGQAAYSANPENRNLRVGGAVLEANMDGTVMARSRRNRMLAILTGEVQRVLGEDLKLLPMNTGCEAIEGAALMARAAFERDEKFADRRKEIADYNQGKEKDKQKRPKAVFLEGNFHGRSVWAKAVSDDKESKEVYGENPIEELTDVVKPGDIDALRRSFEEGDKYAFVLEPVQGESGINTYPDGYIQQVRDLCDEFGVILVFDEVQTGLGRTGKMLAQEHFGVEADITAVGKAASFGYLPVSGILGKKQYAQHIHKGEHGSTFGGSSQACAAFITSLRELEDRGLCEAAAEKGVIMLEALHGLAEKCPGIKEVRGMGLMIGIEVEEGYNAKAIADRLRHSPFVCQGMEIEGVWTNLARTDTIRFSPNLSVPIEALLTSIHAFAQAFEMDNLNDWRNHELEQPKSLMDHVRGFRDEVAYLMKRGERFVKDRLDPRAIFPALRNRDE